MSGISWAGSPPALRGGRRRCAGGDFHRGLRRSATLGGSCPATGIAAWARAARGIGGTSPRGSGRTSISSGRRWRNRTSKSPLGVAWGLLGSLRKPRPRKSGRRLARGGDCLVVAIHYCKPSSMPCRSAGQYCRAPNQRESARGLLVHAGVSRGLRGPTRDVPLPGEFRVASEARGSSSQSSRA